MQRSFVLAAAAAATLLAAGAAHAGGRVDWSIGINVPPIAAVVSAPGYGYGYGYDSPAPDYYAPPVYPVGSYYPPRVVYAPRPRVWLPPAPPLPRFGWQRDGWRDAGWHGDRDRRDDDRRNDDRRDGGRHDGDRHEGGRR